MESSRADLEGHLGTLKSHTGIAYKNHSNLLAFQLDVPNLYLWLVISPEMEKLWLISCLP